MADSFFHSNETFSSTIQDFRLRLWSTKSRQLVKVCKKKVWLEITPVKEARFFFKPQVFDPFNFAHKRTFYKQERRLILSILEALFFILKLHCVRKTRY